MLYAVYGSLREGWWNHRWALEDAEFKSLTKVEGYMLRSNGAFPAAIERDGRQAVVEVYDVTNVPDDIVEAMDCMEFNCGYVKREVVTLDGQQVWMFVMPPELALHFNTPVENDDWDTTQGVF